MKPLVEDKTPRICPVCFGPVRLVDVSENRFGYFERWECERPDAKREFAHIERAKKERGREPGVFILTRVDYEKAWRKRGRARHDRAR